MYSETKAIHGGTQTESEDIREYIASNFLFGDEVRLGDHQSLIAAGILDSTGVVELVAFLEERYAIAVADEDLVPENLDTIAGIAAYVRRKQAG